MLQAVDRCFWTETLEIYDDHVVDVSMTEDDDDNMLVVTQEVEALHIVRFFYFDEPLDEWVLHLVLQFDLTSSINWIVSDEDDTSTNEVSEETGSSDCTFGVAA